MVLISGQCDSVRKDVFWERNSVDKSQVGILSRWYRMKEKCDSVRKDVILKKRKVWMNAKQNFIQYGMA